MKNGCIQNFSNILKKNLELEEKEAGIIVNNILQTLIESNIDKKKILKILVRIFNHLERLLTVLYIEKLVIIINNNNEIYYYWNNQNYYLYDENYIYKIYKVKNLEIIIYVEKSRV
jgi:hypothetical protein